MPCVHGNICGRRWSPSCASAVQRQEHKEGLKDAQDLGRNRSRGLVRLSTERDCWRSSGFGVAGLKKHVRHNDLIFF